MKRVCKITKNELLDYLNNGLSTSEIGKIVGYSFSHVAYLIRKNNLQEYYTKKNSPYILESINTKELAYIIGFIIADAGIEDDKVRLNVAIKDAEVIKFIASVLNCNYQVSTITNKETKKFPNISINRTLKGLSKFIGGNKKTERNLPILKKELEVYFVRGFFDADGCITWGHRKDRNRIWHKVQFSSQLNLLIPLQKILYKQNISTVIRPVKNENCYVIEFANKRDILKFYDYLYADKEFIPLKRKFDNFNALRLELGEFGKTDNNVTIPSQAIDHSIEGVETTGGKMDSLNYQLERPSLK